MSQCILVVAIVEILFIGIVTIVIFIGSRNCLIYIYWLLRLSILYLFEFLCAHTQVVIVV